jgi:pilus assembly protein CpaD
MSGLSPALLFGIVMLALAGCGNGNARPDAREVHAIRVEMRPAELVLMPGPDGALSPADAQRVRDFIDAWRDRGRGPLRVAMPARLGPRAQDKLLGDLKGLVKRRGADAKAIMPVAAFSDAAGVSITFDDFVAVAPVCADESVLMSSRGANVASPQFGCATQRNIAAMVANPADLIDPAASGDASAARGALVIQNHRLGKPTAAQQTGSDKGVIVSKAIQ